MPAAYLERVNSYALYIKYQGGPKWTEYVRRFDDYEEAVKESLRLIAETDSVLRMKVEPVSYLRLTAFTPLEPNFDHFEALKDFVATNPEVAIPPEAMSALKDVLEEHPNAETQSAIEAAEWGEVQSFPTVDALMRDLDDEIPF